MGRAGRDYEANFSAASTIDDGDGVEYSAEPSGSRPEASYEATTLMILIEYGNI